MIHVTINGEDRQFDSPLSIAAMLEVLEIDRKKVALERNLEIVPRSVYDEVIVDQGFECSSVLAVESVFPFL